jgi:mRNA-degrading endonuclease RelE of RelBE toxin-antitoxin system
LPGLPGNYRQRVRRQIEALATNPRPPNAEPLRDDPSHSEAVERYKIRLDRWRIIYRVVEDEGVVRILRICQKHGPETYQGLEG